MNRLEMRRAGAGWQARAIVVVLQDERGMGVHVESDWHDSPMPDEAVEAALSQARDMADEIEEAFR